MPQSGLIFNPATGLYSPGTADICKSIAGRLGVQAFAELEQ